MASKDSRSLSSKESLVRYNLKNKTIPLLGDKVVGVGLGPQTTIPSPKKQGGKSHLNLAQERAKQDIASGKQSSIFRALRARDAQVGVSL